MASERLIQTLSRLETGFRTDAARLVEIERDISATLECARQFGMERGSPEAWKEEWDRQWDEIGEMLESIRSRVHLMSGSITGSDFTGLAHALEAWESLQQDEQKLIDGLNRLRIQTPRLNADARQDWDRVAGTLEEHIDTIQACAQALRIKLEFLREHSAEEVERLIQDILTQLPLRSGGGQEDVDQQLREAASQIEKDHHRFLGFADVVKGLFMWSETAEERVRREQAGERAALAPDRKSEAQPAAVTGD